MFQPLPNAFEIYGLDFLVDETLNPLLLEYVTGVPAERSAGQTKADIKLGSAESMAVQTLRRQDNGWSRLYRRCSMVRWTSLSSLCLASHRQQRRARQRAP